ncbi:hypothetical protein K457DRAFT_1874211 [Linnemannia elongata AG-77]|uniref:Uncharacterized protein n=1 Tax=Linnemannia elongata AG-77 TaxID=1314771 RepID=A0A197K3T2_9FUNG|nr:hypothetical protein K457DRAFT_1874211 [Linnemannia elongata AG-77]
MLHLYMQPLQIRIASCFGNGSIPLPDDNRDSSLVIVNAEPWASPRMLGLKDEETCRLGFLDCFAGLSKMETLRSHVSAALDESWMLKGARGLEWVLEH